MKNKTMDSLYLTVSNCMENSIGLKRGFTFGRCLPEDGPDSLCSFVDMLCLFLFKLGKQRDLFNWDTGSARKDNSTIQFSPFITQYSSVPL